MLPQIPSLTKKKQDDSIVWKHESSLQSVPDSETGSTVGLAARYRKQERKYTRHKDTIQTAYHKTGMARRIASEDNPASQEVQNSGQQEQFEAEEGDETGTAPTERRELGSSLLSFKKHKKRMLEQKAALRSAARHPFFRNQIKKKHLANKDTVKLPVYGRFINAAASSNLELFVVNYNRNSTQCLDLPSKEAVKKLTTHTLNLREAVCKSKQVSHVSNTLHTPENLSLHGICLALLDKCNKEAFEQCIHLPHHTKHCHVSVRISNAPSRKRNSGAKKGSSAPSGTVVIEKFSVSRDTEESARTATIKLGDHADISCLTSEGLIIKDLDTGLCLCAYVGTVAIASFTSFQVSWTPKRVSMERRTKGRQNKIISFQEMQDAHELKMRQMNALLEQKKDRCYELQQQNKFLDAAYVDEDITILEEKIVKEEEEHAKMFAKRRESHAGVGTSNLSLLHKMNSKSMKAKQSTDTDGEGDVHVRFFIV